MIFKILKTESPNEWNNFMKKLSYPDKYFNSIKDYQKPVSNF